LETTVCRSTDIRESSWAECCVWLTVAVVVCAAEATLAMLSVMLVLPRDASLIDRLISAVVAVCSSTAEAMVVW
jgi:hypothetical protein